MNENALRKLEEYLKEDRNIIVISIFGKDLKLNRITINNIIKKDIVEIETKPGLKYNNDTLSNCQCDLEVYFDDENSIVVLNVVSLDDFQYGSSLCKLKEISDLSTADFHLWLERQEFYNVKLLLYLFHISHHILVVHSNLSIDLHYIKLFRILQQMRITLNNVVYHSLHEKFLSNETVSKPYFYTFPTKLVPFVSFIFYQNSEITENINNETIRDKYISSIDSQLRLLLRRYKLLPVIDNSNIDYNYSLFQLDTIKSVFVLQANKICSTSTSTLPSVGTLHPLYLRVINNNNNNNNNNNKRVIWNMLPQLQEFILNSKIASKEVRRIPLKYWYITSTFVYEVIVAGYNKPNNYHNNYNSYNNYRQNNYSHWSESSDYLEINSKLQSYLDIDYKYSMNKCQYAINIARSVYNNNNNLPTQYTIQYHTQQLNKAIIAFNNNAKGPATDIYVNRLIDDCTKIWKSKQICQLESLTGKGCKIIEIHDEDLNKHNSNVTYNNSCNCGRTVGIKLDPFINVDVISFYNNLHINCCNALLYFKLPSNTTDFTIYKIGESTSYNSNQGLLFPGFVSPYNFLFSLNTIYKHNNYNFINSTNYELQKSTLFNILKESKLNYEKYLENQIIINKENNKNDFVVPQKQRTRDRSRHRKDNREKQLNNNNNNNNNNSIDGYIGIEYECTNGHRVLLTKQELDISNNYNGNNNGGINNNKNVLMNNLQIFKTCIVCEKTYSQLQHIYMVTPSFPLLFSYYPKIQANSKINIDKWIDIGLPIDVSLPSNSFISMRLPYIYKFNQSNLHYHNTANIVLQGALYCR